LGLVSKRQPWVPGAADAWRSVQHHARQHAGVRGARCISGRLVQPGRQHSPERLDGIEATGDFFAALGVATQIGHFFERANETPDSITSRC
jgi:hypothetical protein